MRVALDDMGSLIRFHGVGIDPSGRRGSRHPLRFLSFRVWRSGTWGERRDTNLLDTCGQENRGDRDPYESPRVFPP